MIDLYTLTRERRFGAEVKLRILLGTYVLSAGFYDAYYLNAARVRTLIREDFDRAFERVDAIVGPTSPFTAFRMGEKMGDPLQMYLCDLLTVGANLAGIPAISVPCGLANGLPVGFQVLGRPYAESDILAVAEVAENRCAFSPMPPAPGGNP